MPEQETLEQAKKDEQEGKAPSTQAGEFVREEMHHVREGKHGARSPQQAIAIGLSKARRTGVKLGAPKRGRASATVRKRAQRDLRKGQSSAKRKPSATRSRATLRALKREGRAAASPKSLSQQGHRAARKRSSASRHQASASTASTAHQWPTSSRTFIAFSSRSGTSIHLRFPAIAEAAVPAWRPLLRLSC